MNPIKESVEAFLKAVESMADDRNPMEWFDSLVRVNECARMIESNAIGADISEISRAAREILPVLDAHYPQVGGECALVLGVLVEKGLPVEIIGGPLLNGIQKTMELLLTFLEKVKEDIPETETDINEEKGGYWVENRYISTRKAQEYWMRDSRLPQAYASIDNWIRGVVAILSRDRNLLRIARSNSRIVYLADELNLAALRMLLQILEHEMIVVLHPETEQGYLISIDGITDNYQLHILLSDALIVEKKGILFSKGPRFGIQGKRPPKEVVEVMQGDGPQCIETPSIGTWNLYHWTAVGEDGKLPENPEAQDWIWNEGIPADILKLEGNRIVLLGEPKYFRSWKTCRSIDALKGKIEIQKVMTRSEVTDWMNHLAASKRNAVKTAVS